MCNAKLDYFQYTPKFTDVFKSTKTRDSPTLPRLTDADVQHPQSRVFKALLYTLFDKHSEQYHVLFISFCFSAPCSAFHTNRSALSRIIRRSGAVYVQS